jgi:hypothetical protein
MKEPTTPEGKPVEWRTEDDQQPVGEAFPLAGGEVNPELLARLHRLCDEGRDLWDRFDARVRQHAFHPFVAADYRAVLEALMALPAAPGLRFLEWGSATGVITIMADLLGLDAHGIEIDTDLVEQARDLARRTGSGARFAAGSFLPTGYRWTGRDGDGDGRLGTLACGDSAYLALGRPLADFDLVFAYPWEGEELLMHDLMRVHGRPGARLLVVAGDGIHVYRDGARTA